MMPSSCGQAKVLEKTLKSFSDYDEEVQQHLVTSTASDQNLERVERLVAKLLRS
jgi:hypothetical protein